MYCLCGTQKSEMGLSGDRITMVPSFQRLLGRIHFLAISRLEPTPIPWIRAPSLISKASNWGRALLTSHYLPLTCFPPPPSIKGHLLLLYCRIIILFPDRSVGKQSACNAGDLSSIPGLWRSPGEGKGYPLQYSGLENSKDCIVHGSQRVRHDLGQDGWGGSCRLAVNVAEQTGKQEAHHHSTEDWMFLFIFFC